MIKYAILFILIAFSNAGNSSESTIRILNWNIFMIPKPFNFTKQSQRISPISEHVLKINPDIVVFEESFSSQSVEHLTTTLKATFPHSALLGKSTKFYQFLSSGISVFSKFPIKVLDQTFFSECNTTDCFASKGFLLLEVTGPQNKIFHLGATHVQAWDSEVSKKTRFAQFTQIQESIQKFSNDKTPFVLVGDLNIDYSSNEIKEISALLQLDPIKIDNSLPYTSGEKNECFYTPGKGEKKKWIDYIVTRKKSTSINVTNVSVKRLQAKIGKHQCDLSDHHAIEGTITL